jgi:sugar lactone lactonase YvrE
MVGGVCLDAEGTLYECNYGTLRVHRVRPDGTVDVLSTGTDELPASYPNFPAFDPQGNLWYSDSGELGRPSGRLYVVRPDGRTEVAVPGLLHFPNGLCVDEAGEWLYCIQSTASNVLRFPLREGGLGQPELYATLPGTVPDGLALARSGNLYVACYVPDAIYVIEPDGNVELVVQDHGADVLSRPTNAALDGRGQLFYANLGGWHIGAVDVQDPGVPLHLPAGIA